MAGGIGNNPVHHAINNGSAITQQNPHPSAYTLGADHISHAAAEPASTAFSIGIHLLITHGNAFKVGGGLSGRGQGYIFGVHAFALIVMFISRNNGGHNAKSGLQPVSAYAVSHDIAVNQALIGCKSQHARQGGCLLVKILGLGKASSGGKQIRHGLRLLSAPQGRHF
ncbi:MAG: hypothetical protein LBJ14_04745 [Desulfarculales bacterium]|nr:hypothetical protein [Desulfarculales bacterium]